MNNEEILNILYHTQSELYYLKEENKELKTKLQDIINSHSYLYDDVKKMKTDLDKFLKMGKKLTEIEKDFKNDD